MNYSATHTTVTSWYTVIVSVLVMFAGVPFNSGAQSLKDGNINIEPGGDLWIEGSAGVVDFKCEAQKLSGTGDIQNTENPRQNVQDEGNVRIIVSLPVKTLNCGKKAMNRDMYNALKSDSYPTISYVLLEAKMTGEESAGADEWMNIRTRGVMEIAGVADTTEVDVQGLLLDDNRFRVKGRKQIHMDTYNITPPSALLGLIRADKDLVVNFDVTVRLKN